MRTEGDCHKILKMLVNVAFMKGIVEQRKQLNLCKIMRLYCVPLEESDIVVEGEEGDAMYIILVGLFRVSIKGQMVAYLSQGSHFGELALEQHVTRLEPYQPWYILQYVYKIFLKKLKQE